MEIGIGLEIANLGLAQLSLLVISTVNWSPWASWLLEYVGVFAPFGWPFIFQINEGEVPAPFGLAVKVSSVPSQAEEVPEIATVGTMEVATFTTTGVAETVEGRTHCPLFWRCTRIVSSSCKVELENRLSVADCFVLFTYQEKIGVAPLFLVEAEKWAVFPWQKEVPPTILTSGAIVSEICMPILLEDAVAVVKHVSLLVILTDTVSPFLSEAVKNEGALVPAFD